MWKAFELLAIALSAAMGVAAPPQQQRCPFSYCNDEGECRLEANGQHTCRCIGDRYFVGPTCTEPVNHCASKPCQRPSECINAIGQFLCENCMPGYGGQRCNIPNSKSLSKLLLQFNHYSEFGREHIFLLMLEQLGDEDFALELIGENYAIDTWETVIGDSQKAKFRWHQTNDLPAVAKQLGIHHSGQLPYRRGYYHVARETFWHSGLLNIKLLVYDSASGRKMLHNHDYKLLVLEPEHMDCIPVLRFPHGAHPSEPLKVDISLYNNFEPLVMQRCRPNSEMIYKWKIFNSIGTKELYDFGRSDRLLKIPPYRLWFNYQGEVLSSYRLVVAVTEVSGLFRATSEYRCFIFVLPKAVFAAIKGGPERQVGRSQSFTLDAGKSRDFALAPNARQDLLFEWDCRLDSNRTDDHCHPKMGNEEQLHIQSNRFSVGQRYDFYLTIRSKVNPNSRDIARQRLTITEEPRLYIDIRCLRNCIMNSYNSDGFIHLQAVYEGCQMPPVASQYQWSLKDSPNEVLGVDQHFIYKATATETQLEFMVKVKCDDYVGETSLKLNKSPPPMIKDCTITPKEGVSFETLFTIKCRTKVKKTVTVSYQFLVDGFPLDRTHDPVTKTRLPGTNSVTIIICNAHQSCLHRNLNVKVETYTAIDDVEDFLKTQSHTIRQLLRDHDTNALLILCKLLSYKIRDERMAKALIDLIGDFELRTVLDVEQVLTISRGLLESLKPLTNKDSLAFSRYLMKVNQGLRNIISDQEIKELRLKPYEKATNELSELISTFSLVWEDIPAAQISRTMGTSSTDPIAEQYDDLMDFDPFTLNRIENWLTTTTELYKCLQMLGVAAVSQHLHSEPPLIIDRDDLKMQVYAVDPNSIIEAIKLKQHSIQTQIDIKNLKAIAQSLQSESILLQIVTAVNNPFWWYPAEHLINSNILFISAFGNHHPKHQHQASVIALKEPIVFQFTMKTSESDGIETNGELRHTLHMPLFSTLVPAGSAVIITFTQAAIDIQIELKWLRPPRAFEVKHSPKSISTRTVPKAFTLTNKETFERMLYIGLRSKQPLLEAASFTFTTRILTCLSWNFSMMEPQWTSRGCQANVSDSGDLKCQCYHLSVFAGQSYSIYSNEKLGDRMILDNVTLNISMLVFYGIVGLIIMLLFSYAGYRHLIQKSSLLTANEANGMEAMVMLVTGHQSNPISTANIVMTLQTLNKSKIYKIVVRQDPKRLQLLPGETNRFFVPSDSIQQPLKITIKNDCNGRYSAWYCERIVIIDGTTGSRHSYLVQQWLGNESIEIADDRTLQTTSPPKWQRYKKQLSLVYTNWYQFQAVMGPRDSNDLPLMDRTALWVSHTLITLMILACYYGSTTLYTYEDERQLYSYVHWNIAEILLMGFVCYAATVITHLGYSSLLIWLRRRYPHFV